MYSLNYWYANRDIRRGGRSKKDARWVELWAVAGKEGPCITDQKGGERMADWWSLIWNQHRSIYMVRWGSEGDRDGCVSDKGIGFDGCVRWSNINRIEGGGGIQRVIMYYRGPGVLAAVAPFLPPLVSKLDRRRKKYWEREKICWLDRGERSHIIGPRESLVFCNTSI